MVGDVDLERRNSGDRPGRGPDLGGEVRHGREVVAERGADVGEAVACELHPVAGVAGEADHGVGDRFGRKLGGLGGHGWSRFSWRRRVRTARSGTPVARYDPAPGRRAYILGAATAGSANGAPLTRAPRGTPRPDATPWRGAAVGRATERASTSAFEPAPVAVLKKRRWTAPTTTSSSPASRPSSHAGGIPHRDRYRRRADARAVGP